MHAGEPPPRPREPSACRPHPSFLLTHSHPDHVVLLLLHCAHVLLMTAVCRRALFPIRKPKPTEATCPTLRRSQAPKGLFESDSVLQDCLLGWATRGMAEGFLCTKSWSHTLPCPSLALQALPPRLPASSTHLRPRPSSSPKARVSSWSVWPVGSHRRGSPGPRTGPVWLPTTRHASC